MAIERTAHATWEGDLRSGSGKFDVGSGAISGQEVTFASRFTPESDGKTSPEELIAAAHATCFSMALSHGLAQAGNAPDKLETSATVTFQPGEGITKIALTVRGTVPGVDEAGFQEAAQAAKENCPVSQALASVPEITLDASLAG
jgi:lipoyl-dependent peroxiredoxin